jgi:hypothetical protein
MTENNNSTKGIQDMKIGDHIRQGDTLLRRVESVPSEARELKRDEHDRHVLAHGERTGHAHALHEKGVTALSIVDENDICFLDITGGSGATLRHELVGGKKAEHDTITLPDGKYEAAVQVEYTPAELVRVAD